VIVDYAHKPDAVTAALEALRPVTDGVLTIVIGAGGDRDRGKRPMMGEMAGRLADVVIVTDDNPRSEDPAAIRAEIVAGARSSRPAARVLDVADRRAAIRRALASARAGDTVLIAGKGHEKGQQIGDRVLPFDDASVAAAVLDDLVTVAGAR
jgi:UDP-N-acetylmuramoyl-L-alanyl-D-glutamate--2,6-diaminopimelate ligase